MIEEYREMLKEEDSKKTKTINGLIETINYWGYLIVEHQKNEKVARWKYKNIGIFMELFEKWERNPDNREKELGTYLNRITLLTRDDDGDGDLYCPRFMHLQRPRSIIRTPILRQAKFPQKDTDFFDTILMENPFKRDLQDTMFYRQKDFVIAAEWSRDFIQSYAVSITVEGLLHLSGRKTIRCLINGIVRHQQENDLFVEIQDAFNLDDPEDQVAEFLKVAWFFRVSQRFKGANWIEPKYTFLSLSSPRETSTDALKVRNLSVSFGTKQVLKNVNFKYGQGQILGIIGESGAGKTTLLKAVLGEIEYTGSIHIFGVDAHETKRISPSIGYVPQDLSLQYEKFNPLENILAFANQYNLPQELVLQRGKKILEELDLRISAKIEDLSGGQKRRASIAIALAHNPKILFLDEPTSGLDPKTRFELWKYLDIINKEYGTTICVISHYLDEIEFCDHAAIFMNGIGMWDFGSPQDLKKSIPGKGLALEVTLESVNTKSVTLLRDLKGVDFVIQRGERLRILSDLSSEELASITLELLDKNKIPVHSLEFKVEIDMVDYFTFMSKQRDKMILEEVLSKDDV